MKVDINKLRHPTYDVDRRFVERWSPRAMSGEPIEKMQLFSLFEAARWAPSCFNEQPWRFLFAIRDGRYWDKFFSLLVEGNQRWVKNAAVLVVIVSRETFARNGERSRTHSFDTGAAWQSLALQGSAMGLVVHGMAGFDYDKARAALNVPESYSVEAMVAIGHPGTLDDLDESFHEKETPSGRKEHHEFVFEGTFKT